MRSIFGLATLLSLFAAFLSKPSYGWPGQTQFGIGIPPHKLKIDDPILEPLKSKGDTHWLDVSAVVSADAAKVFQVSLDYDHYKEFAPYVVDSRTIQKRQGPSDSYPQELIIWTHMSYPVRIFGIENTRISRYYLHVQPMRNQVYSGDFGLRWVLAQNKGRWSFPTESSFSILDGSWYILPLGAGRTYVRYFLRIRTWAPGFVVKKALRDSLGPGVKELILEIAKRAAKLP